jgi:hypothetical protein
MKFFRFFRRRRPRLNADPNLPQTMLGAMREDRELFANLCDARVLIYWPHGLGDWVHLAAIAPLLDDSNTYAITRFGDDHVSLMDGNRYFKPLYSGHNAPGDGSERGARHFGLTLERCNGGKTRMALPAPLDDEVMLFGAEALLWTDYPETEGRTAYPFHTKARNLARLLVLPERLATFDLSLPLRTTIDFTAPAGVQRALDARLERFAPAGTRVAVFSRTGVTAARKNWGSVTDARALADSLQRYDSRFRVLSMDDDDLGESAAGFRELFGDLDEPFGRLYKALAARMSLFIGVPAGPLHLTMARGGVPTVGLWMAHHPDWYDEPNPSAVHLISRYVRDRGFDRRPATTTKPPSLQHRLVYLDTPAIPVEAVMEAVKTVLQ